MTQTGSFLPEYISFVFIAIILYLMLSTHPRPTKVYFINFLGVLLSAVEILLHRCIYDYIKHNMYSNALLICCAVYFVIYTIILCVIYIYIYPCFLIIKDSIQNACGYLPDYWPQSASLQTWFFFSVAK